MPAGGVRVSVAFDDVTLQPYPVWTDITDLSSSLVASYEISRGRQYEFDRTDTGTAHVTINDRDGLLDPTNTAGPYAGLIQPLLQIKIELWNPVAEEWQDRFRGFIEDYDYVVAPFTHQNQGGDTVGVMRLEISCVDLTAILSAIEMQPTSDSAPAFGHVGGAIGTVFFDEQTAHDRIAGVLEDALIDGAWFQVFTLNVSMQESTYSPGQTVMEVIDDAVDAEFPTVSNRYVDRFGRLAVHGRMAKFDPDGTAADAGDETWDYTHWSAGDGKHVALYPDDTAHIREFAFNQGLDKVYNSAFCTPFGIKDVDMDDQYKTDAGSIATYGYRSWSAENLLIDEGTRHTPHTTGAEECAMFAEYIVANYHAPRNRVKTMTFKSMRPDALGAAPNWALLCRSDIADSIDITISHPGVESAGGFNLEPFFIEGIHETATPLNPDYAMVTLSLDVSPQAYFTDPSGLDGV